MSKDDEVCKHCGREIYYWVNGWLPNAKGSWYHYHNDKEHCSYPYQSYAEPATTTKGDR